jgi:hypothetical protein
MPTANLVEYFLRRTSAAVRHIFKTLPDRFMHIGAGNYIEKPLIRFRILHDRFRFSLDCHVISVSNVTELAAAGKVDDRQGRLPAVSVERCLRRVGQQAQCAINRFGIGEEHREIRFYQNQVAARSCPCIVLASDTVAQPAEVTPAADR